jgi:hypothetical protein
MRQIKSKSKNFLLKTKLKSDKSLNFEKIKYNLGPVLLVNRDIFIYDLNHILSSDDEEHDFITYDSD